jgi:hypothetical protein
MKSQPKASKTQFLSKSVFVMPIGRYQKEISEIERIKSGKVSDSVKDSALIATLKTVPNSTKPVGIFLNQENMRRILLKHGDFATGDIILTANEFDVGVYIDKTETGPEKINLIKVIPGAGIFVLGANRFNGYGVITFFAQYDAGQGQQYLASLKRRGTLFLSKEGGGSSSITS